MTQYFVRFTNSSGTVLTGDTTSGQWFAIGDPAFSISQTLTFRSGATDIDAGEASFSALSLTLGSSSLTGKIDQALQSGAAFKTIEIVGYDSIADKLVKTSSLVLKGAYAASDAIDTYFGTHALSFTYGDIVQSVGSYDASGNLTGSATQGWNPITNRPDDSTAFDISGRPGDPVDKGAFTSAVAAQAPAPQHVFLQLRNADGSALAGLGGDWIELDYANFKQLQAVSLTGTLAGKVTFGPLKLGLHDQALAPLLDQALASGKAFQLELAVYGDRGTGSDVLLDDYQFGLAGLTNSQVGGSGARTLTFDYGSVRMAHSVFGKTGAYTGSTVEGWDRIRNIKLTAPDSAATSFDGQKAPVAFTDLNVTTQGPTATHYYARFTKNDGTFVGGDNGGQWFEVYGTKYGASQTLALGTGGLAVGKVAFADLHINLGPSKLTTTLDSMLKLGQTFQTIELAGYADGPDGQVKVSTTVFKTIGPDSDTVVPDNGLHDFTFTYGGIVESLTRFDDNATPIGVVTAGWDAIQNKADDTPPAAGTDVDPAKIVPISISQREIYVQFRNQDGSALTGMGTKWIKLDAAYFSHEQGLTINTTTLKELQLTFKAGTLGPILDQALAQGGKSFQIEVAAYARTPDGSVLTDDYQFGLAGITAHYAGTYADSYSIAYGSERMLHNVTDPETGAIKDTVVEGWDAVRREVITAPSGQPSSFDAQRAPDSLAGLKTLASSPEITQYYLRVKYNPSPLEGDNKEQWFAVENFSFGATQARDPILEAGGSAAAKSAFNPLTFTLGNSALTTKLAAIMAKGGTIDSIDLVGYAPDGDGKLQTVSSATFKQATIASDTVSALTGAHQFSIDYTTLVERQTQFDATGKAIADIARGWNAQAGKADNEPGAGLNYAPDQGHAGLALNQQHAYVQIRNKDGSPIPGLGVQWIEVDAASLGSHYDGLFSFDPLSISFRPGTLGPQLAKALAQGKALQIELAVYDAGSAGGDGALLEVYQFGRAGLVSDSVYGASHAYQFNYRSYLQKHYAALILTGIVSVGYDLDGKKVFEPEFLPASLSPAQAPRSETALSVFGKDVPITIVSAAADLTDASLSAGDTVAFTLTFSETVSSAGSTLKLSNGATAVLDKGQSSGNELVYIYTVGGAGEATADLKATALTGSVVNSEGQPFDNLAFTLIDTNNAYFPNGPDNTVALIAGTLAGTVAVGGSAAATGKLVVTDPDAGEAGVQGAALAGTFGTFTIKANGSWVYKLTNPAAAAAAKATGQPLVDSFNVLSVDGSASVDVVVTVAVPAHPGALAFTGTAGADTLYGGGDGDTLKGLGGADKLFGLGGADTLVGGAGVDTMTGGAGSDVYWVDDARDVVIEAAGGGTDTVRSTASFRLAANVENLILTGTGKIDGTGNTAANTITGNSGNNVLSGLAGKDTLVGGAGDDTLKGGFGADILTGGSGKDSFVFDTLPAKGEADRVTDFAGVDDAILISRKAFAAFTGHAAASLTGADISFTGKIEKASQHLAYDAAKGTLFYDDDGTGAHAAVLVATLAGAPALALADFALIA
jgi:VCBS repeat-containing protein